ncbi:MAG: 2-C-methyl-D-erythritol 4-phosphate cytidylyltransferase [Gammaproteobacteria bacterium]|nr:2-C-methyl-D-erythritol 4-phosphate cytidylyltransferase [Gammaproteobacteria bacterium]
MKAHDRQVWAIIPATGRGSRMQSDRPKQYLTLGDKTILEHTLDNLNAYPLIQGVVLILHPDDHHWPSLNYRSQKNLLSCEGGKERHHSVFNGLDKLRDYLAEDCDVLIHDAVRPFVTHKDLDQLLLAIQSNEAGAILAAPVADTLKRADHDQNIMNTQSREGLWRAFTPQAFSLERIYQALKMVILNDIEITDDASAMEYAGYHPHLVKSDSRNIKITHPQDLKLAEKLLSSIDQGH